MESRETDHIEAMDGAVPNVSKKRKLVSDQYVDDAASIIKPQQPDRKIKTQEKFYRRRFPESADDESDEHVARQAPRDEACGIKSGSHASVVNVNGVSLCAAQKQEQDNTTNYVAYSRHDLNYLP